MAGDNSEWLAQYRDPRWQKKRLQVMERAGFRCEECGAAETTLNVHHRFYERDAKAWEYKLRDLRCLCECCHEQVSSLTHDIKIMFGRLSVADMESVCKFAISLGCSIMEAACGEHQP